MIQNIALTVLLATAASASFIPGMYHQASPYTNTYPAVHDVQPMNNHFTMHSTTAKCGPSSYTCSGPQFLTDANPTVEFSSGYSAIYLTSLKNKVEVTLIRENGSWPGTVYPDQCASFGGFNGNGSTKVSVWYGSGLVIVWACQ